MILDPSNYPQPLHINIGCGPNLAPGQTGIDFDAKSKAQIRHDIRTGIPFGDGVAERVISEHVFEHFTPAACLDLIRECHRVLKIGGVLAVVMPNAEYCFRNIAAEYAKGADRDWKTIAWLRRCVWGYHEWEEKSGHGHKWGWMPDELAHIMECYNFRGKVTYINNQYIPLMGGTWTKMGPINEAMLSAWRATAPWT